MFLNEKITSAENIISIFSESDNTVFIIYGLVTVHNITGYPYVEVRNFGTDDAAYYPGLIKLSDVLQNGIDPKLDKTDMIYLIKTEGVPFSIAKSFYLDGVNKLFTIPNADLTSLLSGALKSYTLFFVVKRSEINDNQFLLGSTGQNIDVAFISNTIRVRQWDATVVKTLQTSGTFTDTANFYSVAVVIDGTTPANSKIYANAIDEALAFNTLTGSSDTTAFDYYLGSFNSSGSISLNGYNQQFAIVDYACNSSDVISWHNNGKPKDPQTLFGTNCKYFFNPDNSGDTAQFSVVDSVNSITATSVNMVDADKTPITPYANPIADLVTKYGFLNAWSGENIEINGTTTTTKDYASEHDLANPTVASQVGFVGGTSSLGNRPTLVNDGIDDYLYKAVADWRGSDGSGCFIMVYDDDGAGLNNTAYVISSSDEPTNLNYILSQHWNKGLRPITRTSGTTYSYYTTPADIFGTANVVGFGSNGTTNKAFINGVLQTTNVLAGTDSGQWLDEVLNRDNITLFGFITNSTFTTSTPMKLAFIGYLPYTDDAPIIACQNELKTIFKIP